MLARTLCYALVGVDGIPVTVESDVTGGRPVMNIVGLPDAAVKESSERVTGALRNSGLWYHQGRVTVNLSPADVRAIASQKAFGESLLNIEPALRGQKWQLLLPDGSTPIRHAPSMPLTTLQKRWLKAVSLDPRVRLFPETIPDAQLTSVLMPVSFALL